VAYRKFLAAMSRCTMSQRCKCVTDDVISQLIFPTLTALSVWSRHTHTHTRARIVYWNGTEAVCAWFHYPM